MLANEKTKSKELSQTDLKMKKKKSIMSDIPNIPGIQINQVSTIKENADFLRSIKSDRFLVPL